MSTKTASKPALKPAKAAKAVKAPFTIDDLVIFGGYSQLEEGQKELFAKGDTLKVISVVDAENFQCVKANDDSVTDTVFDTEIEKAPKGHKIPAKAEEEPEVETKAPKLKKGSAPVDEPAAEVKGKKAKAEKEEVEVDPSTVPLPIESYDADTQKVIKSDASALKAAKALTHTIAETFWTLGGVLSFIRRHKSYETVQVGDESPYAGNQGFAKYCEDELDLHYRKAMYYIEIYETLAPTGVEVDRIIALGWSKAKEITGVVTKKNAEKWIAKAEKLNREDLQAEVKTAKVKAGTSTEDVTPTEETAKVVRYKFSLFEDQGNVANEALTKARETLGTEDLNAAFSHILTEWLTMQGGSASLPIDEAMKALEQTYSLKTVSTYAKKHYKG